MILQSFYQVNVVISILRYTNIWNNIENVEYKNTKNKLESLALQWERFYVMSTNFDLTELDSSLQDCICFKAW